ncbi:general transcription factor IIE subunit 1 [Phlebotomus argentipes]|uniref:general transcription factor IIE subunit 1 n=1 Tax=Phlebotomus argentipes TaxID=94469 RepID=UPI002892CC18|nr:general transcription factor IIE subunit 1 [Phlebotomus argentipes]
MSDQQLVTEIPSSLKQLARLVVRGFYTIEDSLLVDMLVRNPCMKEDDLCELLKFERKQLRSRIAILKNDKFLQVRLKMETGPDGKAQKVNYYFINYKTFVNVVKYKLDLMRKRMETEERDATSRASFRCPNCNKTFTDLEADQLFDFHTGEFRCTFCGNAVEEDLSALPKKDSRLLLAKFNEQLQPLYDLLRDVESIKLAPECLEPEPVDIDTIRGIIKPGRVVSQETWSGEATRSQGFAVEEARVNVTIGADTTDSEARRKDRPVWMTESTVLDDARSSPDTLPERPGVPVATAGRARKEGDDIMSVLLANERQHGQNSTANAVRGLGAGASSSGDSSDEDAAMDNTEIPMMMAAESESEDESPTVSVGGRQYPIDQITDDLIAQMTPQEKDSYIQVYQETFSHIYE